MSKPSVTISIQTSIRTEAKAFGRSFMKSFIEEEPRLAPEVVSMTEQFKDQFVDLDHFIDEWWAVPIKTYSDGRLTGERFGGPLWKRRSPLASRGKISHGLLDTRGRHLPSSLWFESRWDKQTGFVDIFDKWVALAKPTIGMLHLFTDVERAGLQSEDGSWFETGSFGGPAKPGIPNLGWAMAYGEGYESEVDVRRIGSAGFPVDQVGNVVIVRVTEKLSDVVDNFTYFATKRAELKRFFRPGLIWIDDEPALA